MCGTVSGSTATSSTKPIGGSQHLSCALCILASVNDLSNGAVHNPDIYREYCRIEAVTGCIHRS